jgi:AhpD family alkylhydroperoxidase
MQEEQAMGTKKRLAWVISAGAVCVAVSLLPALAQEKPADAAYRDIEQTLGLVPTYMKMLPEVAIAGAWSEYKGIVLNPNSKLDAKTKQLIALAVAAQVPCSYCTYGHTAFARLNGATDEEIREAVAVGAVVRHWSTIANGTQVDLEAHKRDIDSIVAHIEAVRKARGKTQ